MSSRLTFGIALSVITLNLLAPSGYSQSLSMAAPTAKCGSTVEIPVSIDRSGYTKMDFVLTYDPAKLSVDRLQSTSLTAQFSIIPEDTYPGHLHALLYSDNPLSTTGAITKLILPVDSSAAAGQTTLTISDVVLTTASGQTAAGNGSSSLINIECGSGSFNVGSTSGSCGGTIGFPINFAGASSVGVFTFTLVYDNTRLSNPVISLGTMTSGYSISATDVGGEVAVFMNGPSRSGDGTIANVSFTVLPSAVIGPTRINLRNAKAGITNSRSLAGQIDVRCDQQKCVPGGDALCLQNNRFQIELSASDPRSGKTSKGKPIARNAQTGFFSLVDLTNDPDNPEVFVKILHSPVPPQYWVFYGGLTDFEYQLTVTDTATGSKKIFSKSPYTFCGGNDTSTFSGRIDGPDDAPAPAPDVDLAGRQDLFLNNGRFRVSLLAHDDRTGKDSGGAVFAQNDKFGYFWLPNLTNDNTNPEVFIKIVPFPPDSFWVFHGGLTDLKYTFTVTDMINGTSQSYTKPFAQVCGDTDQSTFKKGTGGSGCPAPVLAPLTIRTEQPREAVVGDFNRDLIPDLFVSNFLEKKVSFYPGLAAGGFGARSIYTMTSKTDGRIIDITTADFNRDGYLDIATANERVGTYSVMLANPQGGFMPVQEKFAGSTVMALAAEDYNSDGKADLAIAVSTPGGGAIELRLGDGAGNFSRKYFALDRAPRDVIAADMNRDQLPDLVVASYDNARVEVWLNRGGAVFGPPRLFPVPQSPQPTALAKGDFNGDGQNDIVVAGIETGSITVMLGDGKGSLKTSAILTAGVAPQGVAVADINLDGYQDVIVTNSGADWRNPTCDGLRDTLSIFLGNGNGTFRAPTLQDVADLPESISAADFDQNGVPDLVVTSTCAWEVTVLMNRCSR